jgi:hypothetical protein
MTSVVVPAFAHWFPAPAPDREAFLLDQAIQTVFTFVNSLMP